MRALLRCDATAAGGVGHLVRCLALAEAATARGWRVEVVGRVTAPLGRRLLAASGVPLLPFAGPADVPADAHLPPSDLDPARLAALVRATRADVLHVDHYAPVAGLRAAVRGAGGTLSSVEDGPFGRREADVVVDPTPGAEAAGRPADGSGTVLLGVRHAPMRSAVARARGLARPPAGRDPHVLVVLGGTDATGAAAAVVAAIARTGVRTGAVTVIVRPDHAEVVRRAGAGLPLRLLGPQDDLPALAAAHDVVVTAAGTTVWELAAVGVATGAVVVAENQRIGYERAVDLGLTAGLGTPDDLSGATADVLTALLSDPAARARLSAAGPGAVDPDGASRVVAAWEDVVTDRVRGAEDTTDHAGDEGARPHGGRSVRARAATVDDADLLRGWRNDPATRAASRSTGEVTAAEHTAWLARVLADDDRLLLVLEGAHDDVPVGTVRFDRTPERGLWEVSITVAPHARGQGWAAPVLACAEEAWRALAGPDARLLAVVRPENAASGRLFTSAGYVPSPERGDDVVTAFVKPSATRAR
ncbi:bifunctional UDP-2,4-diacetamido-2,4,6-trideoxy-beta-L-altropyranose hydrolase/GNAT family N-acetyltransferase [Actinotalea sp. AC32]|nr:bifunctional UDP-2,4-diacetamido-2,4,6-trideoxy-beta-L-altropyranose hydrolase/GNAT family N-acetyltransferase [Actinotalea sp. AC32]